MSAVVPEFRTPVMTLVEASWEDQSGILQRVPARMEDKSAGGACIRVKMPIGVGSKLRVQWRLEQFSGTARYCRSEGREYLVGIQRDSTKSPLPKRPVAGDVPRKEGVPSGDPVVAAVETKGVVKPQESQPKEIPAAEPKEEGSATLTAPPPGRVDPELDMGDEFHTSGRREFEALRKAEDGRQPPKEAGKERKHMRHKWLELAPWRNRQDGPSVSGDGNSTGNKEKENVMSHVTHAGEKTAMHSARQVPEFQVELSPMEDIYRAAGIMIPRKGYSIRKVVEMLNSEHIRGLSKEMKRVALLMALDAAGVALDEVQRDAKARQDALDSYEAEQRKQVEAEWARKAEEVAQIQAELESIKAHYMARIDRTLEGVAREKATFNGWVAMKQQESQSMAEALELCLKAPASEPASPSPVGVSGAVAGVHSVPAQDFVAGASMAKAASAGPGGNA